MPIIKNYRHLERIKMMVKPFNNHPLLTVNQARRILRKDSKYITRAMRDGNLDFFYLRTDDMDYFFIYNNEKFEALKQFNDTGEFDYKAFKRYLIEHRPFQS